MPAPTIPLRAYPFCGDHADKVLGRPCRECELEHARALARELARALDGLHRLWQSDPVRGALMLAALHGTTYSKQHTTWAEKVRVDVDVALARARNAELLEEN